MKGKKELRRLKVGRLLQHQRGYPPGPQLVPIAIQWKASSKIANEKR